MNELTNKLNSSYLSKNKSNIYKIKRLVRKIESIASIIILTASLSAPLAPIVASADDGQGDLQSIAAQLRSGGLPIASIQMATVPGATRYAVYLPQVHISPGTYSSDNSNDSAVVAQGQLYQVVQALDSKGVDYIMAEGDMYGPVPTAKIDGVKSEIDGSKDLAAEKTALSSALSAENADQTNGKAVLASLDKAIGATDRDVILKGAPYKYQANTDGLTLYGAENRDTYNKSAALVRDYFYLQDRMSELRGGGSQYAFGMGATQGSMTSNGSSQGPTLSDTVSAAKAKAAEMGKTDLVNIYSDIEQSINQIKNSVYIDPQAPPSPSRSENPYASVNDLGTLQAKYQADEAQINSTIIDQRNKETAVNFAKSLDTVGRNIGVIQFGAAHQEGLVKELNGQGLSVLIVTTNEVASAGGGIPTAPATPTYPTYPTTPSQPAQISDNPSVVQPEDEQPVAETVIEQAPADSQTPLVSQDASDTANQTEQSVATQTPSIPNTVEQDNFSNWQYPAQYPTAAPQAVPADYSNYYGYEPVQYSTNQSGNWSQPTAEQPCDDYSY